MLKAIRRRFETCKLRLSEEKTKITYCQDYRRPKRKDYPNKFDFLGYSFKPMPKKSNRVTGVFLGFDGVMSMKSRTRIIAAWKEMDFHRDSRITLWDLAQMLNSKTSGLINYFGKLETRSLEKLFRHLGYRISKRVKNKFKKVGSYQKAFDWLRDTRSSYPNMFAHWQLSKF